MPSKEARRMRPRAIATSCDLHLRIADDRRATPHRSIGGAAPTLPICRRRLSTAQLIFGSDFAQPRLTAFGHAVPVYFDVAMLPLIGVKAFL